MEQSRRELRDPDVQRGTTAPRHAPQYLKTQHRSEYEIIVVNGESNDKTVAVAHEHGATVLTQEEEGTGDARHQRAQHAPGKRLAFVDADTIIRPTYLDRMLSFVREYDFVALLD